MNERLQKWDEKFSRGDEVHGFAPSAPLAEAIARLAPGLALDLACGAGRHALFLAEHGWQVRALDGSSVGVETMMEEARRRGVADRIDPRVCDLEAEQFSLEPETFDLVCDFYFLHRPLFEQIRRAVRAGGRFVAAIHVQADTGQAAHRFLLRPGELLSVVEGWGFEVLHAREGASTEAGHQHATAEIVARNPG
jgi:tellurite methyltransferase